MKLPFLVMGIIDALAYFTRIAPQAHDYLHSAPYWQVIVLGVAEVIICMIAQNRTGG